MAFWIFPSSVVGAAEVVVEAAEAVVVAAAAVLSLVRAASLLVHAATLASDRTRAIGREVRMVPSDWWGRKKIGLLAVCRQLDARRRQLVRSHWTLDLLRGRPM